MPRYCFECENCNKNWEAVIPVDKISRHKEFCKNCNSQANRDYFTEGANVVPPQKTLGSRADKNSKNMSLDNQKAIVESNRSGEKLK